MNHHTTSTRTTSTAQLDRRAAFTVALIRTIADPDARERMVLSGLTGGALDRTPDSADTARADEILLGGRAIMNRVYRYVFWNYRDYLRRRISAVEFLQRMRGIIAIADLCAIHELVPSSAGLIGDAQLVRERYDRLVRAARHWRAARAHYVRCRELTGDDPLPHELFDEFTRDMRRSSETPKLCGHGGRYI